MRASQQIKSARRPARRKKSSEGSKVIPGPRRLLQRSISNGKLAAIILLGFGMWAMFHVLSSPTFVVSSVEVVNSQLQEPAQVVELSSLKGRSIWLIEPKQAAEALRGSSYIEAAAVGLSLPNQATIIVEERVPAIRWQAGGSEYLVDSRGLVLGPASQSDPQALVVIDTSHTALQPGDRLDPDALELAQALSVRLPSELGLKPKRIEWDIGYGISVITESDQQIAFGRKDDNKVSLDVKIATLQQLLLDGTGFSFLDLRPTLPYYR